VDYKRFDLAVRACADLGRKLKVIGEGPQFKRLRQMAGPTVQFLGKVSDNELRVQLAGSRALLFPGEEDFGIVPVEAQSFGKPVIAFASGGVLETVRGMWPGEDAIEGPTGVFFTDQSPSGIAEAILRFESMQNDFSPQAIREHSLQFDTSVFNERILEFLSHAVADFKCKNLATGKTTRLNSGVSNS
jgi:glycosyltransferase involved in cell wall biosynthesis